MPRAATDTSHLIFLDSERSVPREAIVPPCAENRRGFSPSLTPRKGHFSSSPWQRHGKTVPKKESALKGHPNMPGPSERVTSSWGALAGLNVLKRINPTALPWAASGLPLRGGNTLIIIESWYQSIPSARQGGSSTGKNPIHFESGQLDRRGSRRLYRAAAVA